MSLIDQLAEALTTVQDPELHRSYLIGKFIYTDQ